MRGATSLTTSTTWEGAWGQLGHERKERDVEEIPWKLEARTLYTDANQGWTSCWWRSGIIEVDHGSTQGRGKVRTLGQLEGQQVSSQSSPF